MEIYVLGTNTTVSDEVEAYAEKKLNKLDRYMPHILEARMELGIEKNKGKDLPIAQLTVRNSRGVILRTEEKKQEEVYAAIDVAVDKMYRQIRRYKGKTKKRKGGEKWIEPAWDGFEDAPMLDETPDYDEQPREAIVRRKEVSLTPMSEPEAIDQMELLGHDFFLFYNGEEDTVNVLYKRKDGQYGILTPRLD